MLYDNDFKSARAKYQHYWSIWDEQNKTMIELNIKLACAQGNASQCVNLTTPTDLSVTEIQSEIEVLKLKLNETWCKVHVHDVR